MKKGILVLIVVVTMVSPVCWAQNWITWIEHPDNPVLDPDSRAYYPCVVFDMDMFGGAGVSAPYKVWYQSETGIVHGYSFDGVEWFDAGNALGLVSSAAHPWVLYDVGGFGDGVFYKMWYWTGIGEVSSINAIHYAESVDGLNWVKSSGNPIMHQDDTGYTREPWRSERTYTPMVVYDASKFSGFGNPALYKMWYSGRNPDNNEYTIGVTYGELQVPVGGSLEPMNYREIVLPILVSALVFVVFFVSRRID